MTDGAIELRDVIDAWNSQADDNNKWDILGCDEMVEFALSYSAETVNRLSEYIRAHCYCPCCEQYIHCLDGCTYATDSPGESEQMKEARSVLYPKIHVRNHRKG